MHITQAQPSAIQPPGAPRLLRLELTVRDPEVVSELQQYEDGPAREGFALSALRLGVLALRQANGMLDTANLRQEAERLCGSVKTLLAEHSTRIAPPRAP